MKQNSIFFFVFLGAFVLCVAAGNIINEKVIMLNFHMDITTYANL